MPPFLHLVVNDLLRRFEGELSNVTLVFPSRRASLFFSNYLSEKISKPIWAPNVLTISEIMYNISGLKSADSINLVAKLYHIYNKVRGKADTFDSFFFWGEVMLADFDQIDKYLVNAEKLYANVKDIKEIEERFGGLTPEQTEVLKNYLGVIASTDKSDLRDNFLTVWKILGQIYQQFSSELLQEEICYEGLAYRKAAEKLLSKQSTISIPENIIFIGFNALNSCEKELFTFCKKSRNALFYWDYDSEFLENEKHEAGTFIRTNLLLFPNALPEDCFASKAKNGNEVYLVAAPSTVTQAKLIPKILGEILTSGGSMDEKTALIFPKENLLMPVLQSLPPEIDQLNITMGYPLRETPAFSLAEFLVKLQMNCRKNKDNTHSFYYVDVLSALNHPYLKTCEPDITRDLIGNIKKRNLFYPSQEFLARTPFLLSLFSLIAKPSDLPKYINGIVSQVAKVIAAKNSQDEIINREVDLEFLFALHKCTTRIGGILASLDVEISHRIFLQIFRKVFIQERVSFTGEPLSGLQLMGFLETRALDFENIVILSFNDDIIPGRNHPVSFITPSLRVAYGLPDYKHHDSVYAYYFYRLLHRAKRVYLVYSSRTEGLSSGEKSRFALQLEYEQMVGKVKTIPVSFQIDSSPQVPITVEKTDEVMQQLLKNLKKKEKGVTLSPSGLTTYLTCPLKFYFRYGVGIHEEDEISEEVGAQEFGLIIHKVMEELYREKVGKEVSSSDIAGLLKNSKFIEETLDSAFSRIFLNETPSKLAENLAGRNLLARNAMLYTIKKMLEVDKARAPFLLINHEQEVQFPLEIIGSELVEKVFIGGIIDRIERVNDTMLIIDYKTGRASKDKGIFKDVVELFDPQKIDKNKEVFQIFCYSLAMLHHQPRTKVKPGLWFVKTLKPGETPSVKTKVSSNANEDVNDFNPYAQAFSDLLMDLISSIFNRSNSFTQTEKLEKCKICPYVAICGRD